jgi:ATP-binding cassette subfamily B protein RaxB
VTANLARLPLTRLMIAHRPDTIAGAERVIVLDGGAVDELPRAAGRDTLAT